ncbi:hypothetical protein L195_g027263, partial [Trifolium pratense]
DEADHMMVRLKHDVDHVEGSNSKPVTGGLASQPWLSKGNRAFWLT